MARTPAAVLMGLTAAFLAPGLATSCGGTVSTGSAGVSGYSGEGGIGGAYGGAAGIGGYSGEAGIGGAYGGAAGVSGFGGEAGVGGAYGGAAGIGGVGGSGGMMGGSGGMMSGSGGTGGTGGAMCVGCAEFVTNGGELCQDMPGMPSTTLFIDLVNCKCPMICKDQCIDTCPMGDVAPSNACVACVADFANDNGTCTDAQNGCANDL